jgi:putative phage-type endonuclease
VGVYADSINAIHGHHLLTGELAGGSTMQYYRVDHIAQDTEGWRRWRNTVIGGTDAPIIMGANRWKGRTDLIEEKLGRKQPFAGNSKTQQGKELEPIARDALNRMLGSNLQPCIVQSTWSPFLAASLDGVDESKNLIVEIKCGQRTYEQVDATGRIPSHYVAQVQHILMVSRSPSLIFAAFYPGKEIRIVKAFYDKTYIDELHSKEYQFANELAARGLQLQKSFVGEPINFSKS